MDLDSTRVRATRNIARASLAVAAVGLAGALVGFARELSVAGAFGISRDADAFYTSLFLPTLVYNLLVAGAISSAVIPALSRSSQLSDQSHFQSLAFVILSATAAATVGLAVLDQWFLQPTIYLIAPGLPGPTAAVAARLLRTMIFLLPLFATSGVLSAVLNSTKRFAVAASAPVVFSLAIIIAANLPNTRGNVEAIAIGAFAGAAVQTAALLFVVVRIHGLISIRFRNASLFALKNISWLAAPILGSLIIGQFGLVVERILASALPVGTLASLNYSQKLIQLPASVLAAAVATVILPYLSTEDPRQGLLQPSLDAVFFVMAPAVAFVVATSTPLVTVLFLRGAFTTSAVSLTAAAASLYVIGQLPYSLSLVITRGLYARNAGKLALVNAIIWVGLNVCFDLVLVRPFGLRGLAAGSSLAAIISLFVVMRSAVIAGYIIRWGRIANSWGLMTVAALCAMGISFMTSHAAGGRAGAAAACGVGLFTVGVTYIAVLWFLRARILFQLVDLGFPKRSIWLAQVFPK